MDVAQAWLDDARAQLGKYRALAEAALAQVGEADLVRPLGGDENSIALVMKHLSGNMASRWTDFLTTDGEKPDRRRDAEFELDRADTPAELRARWDAGWDRCLAAVRALRPEDLPRTVTIRGEPHTVLQAVQRQLTHYAYHVGQIVLLARHWVGPRWRSLSIPKGMSAAWEVGRDGRPYRS